MIPLSEFLTPFAGSIEHWQNIVSGVMAIDVPPESRVLADAAPGEPDIFGSTAVLPVCGVLMKNRSWITDYLQIQTYDVLVERIQAMDERQDISNILLAIDSPGGQAMGLEEVAQAMADAATPIVAHIDGLGASAAYYIASAASSITATISSITASIGTIMTMYDYSKFFEKYGISAEVFRSGDQKAPGQFGEAMSDEQKAQYQGIVDGLASQFWDQVQSGRSLSNKELKGITDGRAMLAAEALTHKLIDAIASNAEAMDLLEPPSGAQSQLRGPEMKNGNAGGAGVQQDTTAAPQIQADLLKALQNAFPEDPGHVLQSAIKHADKEDPVLHARADYAKAQSEQIKAKDQEIAALKAQIATLSTLEHSLAPAGTIAPAGTAPAPAATAPAPAGTATAPAGTAPAPAGTATAPAGTAPAPAATAPAVGGQQPVSSATPATPLGNDAQAIKAYEDKVKELEAAKDINPHDTIGRNHPELADAYDRAIAGQKGA